MAAKRRKKRARKRKHAKRKVTHRKRHRTHHAKRHVKRRRHKKATRRVSHGTWRCRNCKVLNSGRGHCWGCSQQKPFAQTT